MKKISFNNWLSTKIGLSVLGLGLLIAVIGSITIQFLTKSSLEKLIGQNHLVIAEETMVSIDRVLYDALLDVELMVDDREIENSLVMIPSDGEDSLYFNSQLEDKEDLKDKSISRLKEIAFITGPWDLVYVADTQGNVTMSSLDNQLDEDQIKIDRNLFKTVMDGNYFFSDRVTSPNTGKKTILFAAPVRDKNKIGNPVVGLVVGEFSWAQIEDILDNNPFIVHLFDVDGNMTASNHIHIEDQDTDYGKYYSGLDFFSKAKEAESGYNIAKGTSSEQEGEEMLYVYTYEKGFLDYSGNNWILIQEENTKEALFLVRQNIIRVWLLIIGIVAGSITLLFYFLQVIVIKPITKLTIVARAISKGKFDLRAEVTSHDEIGRLSESFNKMSSELIKSQKKTAELNEVFRLLNKILRHDMLNDLSVLQGSIDNYLQYGGKKVDIKQSLKDMEESTQRSIGFIKKMKELEGALVTGSPLKKINIEKSARIAAKNFPEIKVTIHGKGEVMADSVLDSVFINLFRNAIVHGKTDKIEVEIDKKGKLMVIRVIDFGKGIDDEIKKKLFQEGAKFGETGHSGLGLYIVRKTIERYGGTISIEDNKPKGTVFVISIPRMV